MLAPLPPKQEVVGSRLTLFTIFYYKFRRILQNLVRKNSNGHLAENNVLWLFFVEVSMNL